MLPRPSHLCVKALTLSATAFGQRAFQEVIRKYEVLRVGSQSDRTSVPLRWGETPDISLSARAEERLCEGTLSRQLRVLTRSSSCWHLDLGLPVSITVGK